MAKQTAVEWLVEELEKHYVKIDLKNTAAYYTAKQKEKDQIVNIYKEAQILMIMDASKQAEQYYNENYKK